MKFKYYSYTSLVLLGLIITFGYINRVILATPIMWSDRDLIWSDFEIVPNIKDGFDASVYSEIYYPSRITKDESKVYAYMNPNQSERLLDSVYNQQLLKHEQYHFNITEYYARLTRKDIIEKGINNVSRSTLTHLYEKYRIKRDSIQREYDEISEHNANQQKQRYWELKIDDLLRQTAYYENPDILSYQKYTNKKTECFKHIYHTLEHKILTSYPVSENHRKYGSCYQVIRNKNEVIIKFYKNGKLTNGGYFKTAITKIVRPSASSLEIHYFNKDTSYNNNLSRAIQKVVWNEHEDMINTNFDANKKPVYHNAVHKTFWKKDLINNSRYATYYGLDGKVIPNKDGSFHEKRRFDVQGRTIKIEAFDVENNPVNDRDYISVYEYEISNNHKLEKIRLFDNNGDFAIYLDEYNLEYYYDERGNLKKSKIRDKNGNLTENKNGICIYEYTSDISDNTTSVKRYNVNNLPTTAYDDYFHEVIDYDKKDRVVFKAKYYSGYVLAFDDNKNGVSKYEYLNDTIFHTYNIDAFNNIFNNDHGIAITQHHIDKKNQITKEIFLDDQECFATSTGGVEMYGYTYDSKGNLIKKTGLDSIGHPKAFNKDIAITRWEYDDHNNETKTIYYDINDKLANGDQNVTYILYSYNANDMLVEKSHYNKYMKPVLNNEIFRTRYHYNKMNKDTLTQGFNTNNKLIKGVCTTRSIYNEYGNEIRRIYYNAKNNRAINQSNVSAIEYLYDNQQRYVGYRNYNRYDQPANDWQGLFSEVRTLNRAGYITKYCYFNKNQIPVNGPDGYHSKQYIYDDSDFISTESTYGTDNTLIANSYGVAIYEYTRAASGLIRSIKYYDKNEEPYEIEDGSASIYYKPDMNGLYFLDKKLDAKGEEIIDQENTNTKEE